MSSTTPKALCSVRQLLLEHIAHVLNLARSTDTSDIHIRDNKEGDADFAPNSA
jgi:hypothetical protein